MKKQNFEQKNEKILSAFNEIKQKDAAKFRRRINLSWSNWGFGMEPLAASAIRLAKNGVTFIELHGNHYGKDIGYKPDETMKILSGEGIKVAGICGMFSTENDLSSNSGIARQNAVDYLRRTIDFAAAVKAGYVLVVPGAVGRPQKYDDSEFDRSAATLRIVADLFAKNKIKAAVEPIRSAEVSFCHTVADAKRYIEEVNHPGVKYINGDVYHMQSEESHIGSAIVEAGDMLINLHLADSNRCALGDGSLDVDTLIRALYVIGYNQPGHYVTPEPLGPGGDPYPAMHGKTNPKLLDALVKQTISYFREREEAVLNG
jgi:D-psicose/D-tagatose/L-ribulose 3-epimerase